MCTACSEDADEGLCPACVGSEVCRHPSSASSSEQAHAPSSYTPLPLSVIPGPRHPHLATLSSPPSPRHALLAPVTWHQEEEEDIFEDMMAVLPPLHGDGSEEEEGEAGVPHGPHAPLPVDPLALGPAPLLPQPHGNVVPAPAVPEDSPGW